MSWTRVAILKHEGREVRRPFTAPTIEEAQEMAIEFLKTVFVDGDTFEIQNERPKIGKLSEERWVRK
jgi:hypothetical protein